MKTQTYTKPTRTTDLSEAGRLILAHGEVTGHRHEVLADIATDIPPAQFFEEPDTKRRILLITAPCTLRHDEHAPIGLDPSRPVQLRQGDVLLQPLAPGVWYVIRQKEYGDVVRQVAD